MDIQTRKINFVQECLRLKKEQLIAKLEKLLLQEKKKDYEKSLTPMSQEEFDNMINKAKKDAEEGKVIEARKLKDDIDKWE